MEVLLRLYVRENEYVAFRLLRVLDIASVMISTRDGHREGMDDTTEE
jgi:hypothetical protein